MLTPNIDLQNKSILITGAAGFIGANLVMELLKDAKAVKIVGLDNMSDYYDVSIKEYRLAEIDKMAKHKNDSRWTFVKGSIADRPLLERLFQEHCFDLVVNLAAQAGVRYSITNPDAYIESNLVGFYNILEACRRHPVAHLVYASSSSVYGMNQKVPYALEDPVDNPVSLYAATKKSDELMAHAYSKLYNIPSTGLRFFTVYGPAGRPDMAYYKFAKKIMAGEPIQIYNHGDMRRDFTYIDDIVAGIEKILCHPPGKDENGAAYKIYNIGNNKPEKLMDYISVLERCLGKEAKKEFLPMQPGDVYETYADVTDLMRDFDFKPSTTIEEGLSRFAEWFLDYYKVK